MAMFNSYISLPEGSLFSHLSVNKMLSIKLPFTNESTDTFMAKSLSLRSCMCVSYPLANVPKNNVHILLVELICLVGFNPSEKYESQLGLLFPIDGNIKNVPNHQPVIYLTTHRHIWVIIRVLVRYNTAKIISPIFIIDIFTGWWFQPFWKIWVRQLGWWHSQYIESHKIQVMFQTTNQVFVLPSSKLT